MAMAQSGEHVGTVEERAGRVYRKCSTVYEDIASAQREMESLNAKLLIAKKEKAKKQQHHRAIKKRVPVGIEDIAAAIVRMTDGNYNMAETFLVQYSSRIGWRKQQSISDCLEEIRLVLNSTQEDGRLDGAANMNNKWVTSCAASFISEFRLAQWVQQQNLSLGIAPHSRTVAVEAKKLSLLQEKQASAKVRKQFLRRWRKRWQINMGIIPCREVLPKKDMQQKVCCVARFDLLHC